MRAATLVALVAVAAADVVEVPATPGGAALFDTLLVNPPPGAAAYFAAHAPAGHALAVQAHDGGAGASHATPAATVVMALPPWDTKRPGRCAPIDDRKRRSLERPVAGGTLEGVELFRCEVPAADLPVVDVPVSAAQQVIVFPGASPQAHPSTLASIEALGAAVPARVAFVRDQLLIVRNPKGPLAEYVPAGAPAPRTWVFRAQGLRLAWIDEQTIAVAYGGDQPLLTMERPHKALPPTTPPGPDPDVTAKALEQLFRVLPRLRKKRESLGWLVRTRWAAAAADGARVQDNLVLAWPTAAGWTAAASELAGANASAPFLPPLRVDDVGPLEADDFATWGEFAEPNLGPMVQFNDSITMYELAGRSARPNVLRPLLNDGRPFRHLSIVMASQLSDYGGYGGLEHRTLKSLQHLFIALAAMPYSSEVVLVDWHPRNLRSVHRAVAPFVSAAPESRHGCTLRTILVDKAVHDTFANSNRMEIYLAIAKNVGIRRAHGDYVLLTNPDMILPQHILRMMAPDRLDPERNTFYRADKWDVREQIPLLISPIDIELFCRPRSDFQEKRAPLREFLVAHGAEDSWLVLPDSSELKYFMHSPGEFMLFPREMLWRLRGHPEWSLFGWADISLAQLAVASGAKQAFTAAKIFHQVHHRKERDAWFDANSQDDYFVPYQQRHYANYTAMIRDSWPVLINDEGAWGLAAYDFAEVEQLW